jgi:hypothetical protein
VSGSNLFSMNSTMAALFLGENISRKYLLTCHNYTFNYSIKMLPHDIPF